MSRGDSARKALLCCVVLVCVCCFGRQAGPIPAAASAAGVAYTIAFGAPESHILHVTVELRAADNTVRMPVWNALYQVRDFSQYVESVSAYDAQGKALTVTKVDKATWSVPGAARVEYDIFTDVSGPYSAEYDDKHAFLNLAQVLMYSDAARKGPVVVSLRNVPQGWRIATVLPSADGSNTYSATDYDTLVDNPIEAGRFHEISFVEGGATYRIAIDAERSSYDAKWIESSVHKIVSAEAEWMGEHPCREYLFIYHFPKGLGGGGMEHACSTAIDVPASRLESDRGSLLGVTAHEFFHAWNVKRIRPKSLEPVDYTKEQYTRSLWFSEGVTSTVEDYILLRAGLIDEPEYLRRLGVEITNLQKRPARLHQSAEESSLEAWLERYTFYRRADRSVSYYNKGDILGVMLDLAIRDATGGAKSLRDVLRWMKDKYPDRTHPFPDSDGVREAVDAVTGSDFKQFFNAYVAGVEEIPYNDFLGTVGLRIEETQDNAVAAGFAVSPNFNGPPVVTVVDPGSRAERAGLRVGDTITAVNGKKITDPSEQPWASLGGELVRFRVRAAGQRSEHDLEFALDNHRETQIIIRDVDHPSDAQLRRRSGWLGSATVKTELKRSAQP